MGTSLASNNFGFMAKAQHAVLGKLLIRNPPTYPGVENVRVGLSIERRNGQRCRHVESPTKPIAISICLASRTTFLRICEVFILWPAGLVF